MQDKLEANAAALKRWRTRLKRALTAIDKLERQRKRLEAQGVKRPAPVQKPSPVQETAPVKPAAPVAATPRVTVPSDDLGIPAFLQRNPADAAAAEQIRREQADTKRRKSLGRIAKVKAKAAGDLKKMPLSGKAAKAFINEEKPPAP